MSAQIQELYDHIKEFMPSLAVTKENLIHPTPDFVCKFYSCFINDFNEKVSYLTGTTTPVDHVSGDRGLEDQLYVQMMKLVKDIFQLDFTLADIYKPRPVKTKHLCKLCIHFLIFVEGILNEMNISANKIFDMEVDTEKLLNEKKEILEQIDKNARRKAETMEEVNGCKEKEKSVNKFYEKLMGQKMDIDKKRVECKKQLENFKLASQKEDLQLKYLLATEKELSEQKVTEEEYKSITETVTALNNELEKLNNDDINMADDLECENNVLHHVTTLVRLLENTDFDIQKVKKCVACQDEIKNTANLLEKLNSKEVQLQRSSAEDEEKLSQAKEKLTDLQDIYKTTKKNHLESLDKFAQDKATLKAQFNKQHKNNNYTILKNKKEILKHEEDIEKLKISFVNQYNRVAQIEYRVGTKYSDLLQYYKKFM